MTAAPAHADLVIAGGLVVTMDAGRRIIADGALAIAGGIILAVGKSAEIARDFAATETVQADGFVLTPGLINTHVHITGEPLTRGAVPDDSGWAANVFGWLVPIHMAYTAADERLSAQLAALEMLHTGTTTFLEAGTVRFLDAAMDGLATTGIRGRVGQWAWDFAPEDESYPASATDAAIRLLQDEVARYPADAGQRLAAWPVLVGHYTCSDTLWRAARAIADAAGLGVAAHMSPVAADPDWFLARHGRRPVAHLAKIGALGTHTILTHAVHLDAAEVALLAEAGAAVAHCPTAALKGGYGAGAVGRFPEMQAQGVRLTLGTDGNNNGNAHDLGRTTYLLAGLFKDARQDPAVFGAAQAYECATLGGAAALRLADQVGALAVGMKADIVAHDTQRPEWCPLFDVINQLVWSADGRSVHSVWVDGVRVVENYRSTLIDEAELYAQCQAAGTTILARAGLAPRPRWPVT